MIPQSYPQPHAPTRPNAKREDYFASLIDSVGSEAIIAARIIRQAVEDWNDAQKGKQFRPVEYPRYIDPMVDLQTFFSSKWFTFLSWSINIDPDAIRDRIIPRQVADH